MPGKHTTTQNKKKRKKNKKALKVFIIIVVILILIIIGVVAGGYWYISDKLGKMQQVNINEEDLNINAEVDQNLSGYRNIAIFGVDSRDLDMGKGNRSDCIMIASINNKTKEVKLLSVYRDTYLQIEGYGLDKVTHSYSYGEAPLALNTLNTNLDLNIKEFVTVNFNCIVDAVNALGGIEMKIEEDEIEYINMYIHDYLLETGSKTGKTSQYIPKAGTYNLDGVQALSYGRIRYTAGGDYKRTERMRNVLTAMLKKLQTKSIGEINSLLDQILPNVYTNISSGSIFSEIPSVMKYKITNSLGWPYQVKDYTTPTWYAAPVTLESNVVKMHEELFGETNYQVSDTVKNISNKIINKTGYSE